MHGTMSLKTWTSISLIFSNKFSSTCFKQKFNHQEVITVHATYSIYRASIACIAANTIRFLKLSEDMFNVKVNRVILFQNYSFPVSWSLNCLLDKLSVSTL